MKIFQKHQLDCRNIQVQKAFNNVFVTMYSAKAKKKIEKKKLPLYQGVANLTEDTTWVTKYMWSMSECLLTECNDLLTDNMQSCHVFTEKLE